MACSFEQLGVDGGVPERLADDHAAVVAQEHRGVVGQLVCDEVADLAREDGVACGDEASHPIHEHGAVVRECGELGVQRTEDQRAGRVAVHDRVDVCSSRIDGLVQRQFRRCPGMRRYLRINIGGHDVVWRGLAEAELGGLDEELRAARKAG